MLEKEKAIDAVLCATPDHLHAYVSTRAMRAGKHVYCEKPLTHNIWEARQVARMAEETGRRHADGQPGPLDRRHPPDRANGSGPARSARSARSTPGSAPPRWNPTLTGRPAETPPVPAGLNWDLWLGPREPRPFHPAYFPVAWRDFWAFGSSTLGDFGCHDLDAACLGAGPEGPAHASRPRRPARRTRRSARTGRSSYYQFGPRGDMPPVNVTWYDGGLMPRAARGSARGRKRCRPAACCSSATTA